MKLKIYYNLFLAIFLSFFFINFANSFEVEKKIPNPKLEFRAQNLFKIVNCPICNGQVIENSNSEFSSKLRSEIRKEIIAGKSDDDIKKWLIEQFGNDIIKSDNIDKNNLILWVLPLLLCFILLFNFLKKCKFGNSRNLL